MKILILNYEYPPLGGGAGIVSHHLANEFIYKGHEVTILTTWYNGEQVYHSENGLTIIRLISRRKHTYQSNPVEMYDWLQKAKQYARHYFKEGQFDICLANFTLPGGEVADFLKQQYKLPFAILSHGHDIPWFSPKQMFLWHLICFPVIRKLMLSSSANILLTDRLKRNADRFLGRRYKEKNIVIPNGVISSDLRKGFDASDKIIRALFVGRLVKQKDPLSVIKAFHKLQQSGIPIHLKIIGDGALKGEMEEYILKHRLSNVDVLGKISQSQVMEEYTSAHMLLAPSREEAMSLSVLEAISCGLFAIVTNASGNKEIVLPDINGYFVEYGNPDDIVEKVKRFYNEKFLANYHYPEFMIEETLQHYSWEKTAEKYLQLFSRILDKKDQDKI